MRKSLIAKLSTVALCVSGAPFVSIAPVAAISCAETTVVDGSATVVTISTVGTCTWTVPAGLTVIDNVLIVGGGGGGGFDQGGGGGAGGLVDLTNVSVTPGSALTVIVGGGGAGATGYSIGASNNGGASSFNGVVASGGGAGGSGSLNGANGGSGGGGGYAASGERFGGVAQQPGSAAGGSGNNGGSTFFVGYYIDAAGGGGGAGSAGANATRVLYDFGGAGGAGVARTITGTSRFYAGGGGGVVILRFGSLAPSPSTSVSETPASWIQSVGRVSETAQCEPGWSPSWAHWMNSYQGGWVCNREIFWDLATETWQIR